MINSLMIAVAFLALSGDGFYNKSSLSNILTAFEAGLHAPRFENIDEEISTVAPTTVDLSPAATASSTTPAPIATNNHQ